MKPSATALKIARKYLREIDADDFGTPDGHDIDHCAAIVDAGLAEVREVLNQIAELRGPKGEILYEGACQQLAKAALAKLV